MTCAHSAGPAGKQFPWLTVSLLGASALLLWVAPLSGATTTQGPGLTFWQLVLSQDGSLEAWRWLSAHLLHTDASHLLLNAAALLILGAAIESSAGGRRRLLRGLATGAAAVTLWFYLLADVRYYCGLSGVLNGCFMLALNEVDAAATARGQPERWLRPFLVLIALGAFAKASYELVQGTPLLIDQQWPTAPGAHLAGLLAGTLLVIAERTGLTGR
jgi:rhomboid family GlyGly-CTERM serine protease